LRSWSGSNRCFEQLLHHNQLRPELMRLLTDAARESGAEKGLCAQAVDKLVALGIARVDGGEIVPLPALARFAVEEPLVLGATPEGAS
jgi:hypothetical protein